LVITSLAIISVYDAVTTEAHRARCVLAGVVTDDARGQPIITDLGVRESIVTRFITRYDLITTYCATNRWITIAAIARFCFTISVTPITEVIVLIVTLFIVLGVQDPIATKARETIR
jgi:hypothetical protein